MTITIWVKPTDLEALANLIKKIETQFVLDSEIRDSYLEWDDQPQTRWIQAQIAYSTYLKLKEA
jgi:hypothetical protein